MTEGTKPMYIIIGTHDFYGPSQCEFEVDRLVVGMDGNDTHINQFETREAADAYIKALERERYYLMHNESNAPSYRTEEIWSDHDGSAGNSPWPDDN